MRIATITSTAMPRGLGGESMDEKAVLKLVQQLQRAPGDHAASNSQGAALRAGSGSPAFLRRE